MAIQLTTSQTVSERIDNQNVNNLNAENLISAGWNLSYEIWEYVSADAPSFVFRVNADVTNKFCVGMRIKLTQTTVKYFIITKISYASPYTTVTVYGGTDYTLVDAVITDNYYSSAKAPFGFPLDPNKWSVIVTDTTLRAQANPVVGTFYNVGAIQISVPIGAWKISMSTNIQANGESYLAIELQCALSASTNSISDTQLKGTLQGNEVKSLGGAIYKSNDVVLTSKTTYYIINSALSGVLTNLYFRNDYDPAVLKAVSAYL